ncbi:hypothetical protein N7508_003693 [Penicillium antarcticum]|uniref:uncharacterized protein n=1 Tax=Penicillium antarcticum TaxID=416450 RepID=UPI0023A4DD6C|nr:uncharacterized protein N7508_003693 [Penicillium antarcticum]KAJ5312863.1 hypothetical protein N7508_003693 [Penicillium antarcticum]
MKLPITIISMLALSSALTLTPRAAEGDPVVECGDLDVMTVDPPTSPRASPLATSHGGHRHQPRGGSFGRPRRPTGAGVLQGRAVWVLWWVLLEGLRKHEQGRVVLDSGEGRVGRLD